MSRLFKILSLCFLLFSFAMSTRLISRPASWTTTLSPLDCCSALEQQRSMSEFPDGIMTFVYNSGPCRTSVVANCSQPAANLNLYAGIVANGVNFLDLRAESVTFPGTCKAGQWCMGNPPLLIQSLECVLMNPP